MIEVDIWSKGEVASYLAKLAESGQVKECKHLIMRHGHTDAFYPECAKDWASRVNAHNVSIDITAYRGPSSYSWPQCPNDCPHFEAVKDFLLSVSRENVEEGSESEASQPSVIKERGNGGCCQPKPPEKVTIPWLLKHVPVQWWFWATGILFAVFIAGVQASKITLIKDIFGLNG